MKRYFDTWITAALCCMLSLLILSSCSDTDAKGDAEALLRTVPADAVSVGVIDLDGIIDDNGGKADGTKIKNGEKLKTALAKLDSGIDYTSLFDGESGVHFTAAVYFSDGRDTYLTALIEDGEKFRNYVSSKSDTKWTKDGNMYIADRCIQMGNQIWLGRTDNHAQLVEYADLTKARSFLSNDYAKSLAECDHSVVWYTSINGAIDKAGLSFAERTTLRMASSMLFDNVAAMAGTIDIKDKTVKATVEMLDNNGKPAKCNLKFGKIDVAQVAALGGNANTIFAISLPKQLIEQIMTSAESFGGAMPPLYARIFTPIDGTVAIASSVIIDNVSTEAPFTASIATSDNMATLMEALYNFGLKPTADKNILKVSMGNYGAGAFKVADAAKEMEGAAAAVVMRYGEDIDITATLRHHNGGLSLDISAKTPNSIIEALPEIFNKK